MEYELTDEEMRDEVTISISEYERLSKHQEIEDTYKKALEDIYEILTGEQDIEEMKEIIRDTIMEVESL